MADALINYVKFLRGTPTAYANLQQKDNDTLYFVSEADADTGALYLGSKLISGSTSSEGVVSYLSQLSDVDTSGAVNNSLLGFDSVQQKWVPMDVNDLVNVSVMTGAGADAAGAAGLVPAPAAGQEGCFLRGDGTWSEIEQVSADNVQLEQEKLVITSPIGTITQEMIDEAGGSYELDTTDKSLSDILTEILTKEEMPVVALPTATISAAGGSGEVGSTFTLPTATLKITSLGSYSYGCEDAGGIKYGNTETGVTIPTGNATLSETGGASATSTNPMTVNSTLMVTATGNNSYTDAPITFNFTGAVNYVASDRVPLSNTGNKQESLKIANGAIAGLSKSVTFSGYRNLFYGANVSKVEINSANIRALTSAKSTTNNFSIPIPDGTTQIIIAVPEGREVTSVIDTDAFNTESVTVFTKSTVIVNGANETAPMNYNVYVYEPLIGLYQNTYNVTVGNEV